MHIARKLSAGFLASATLFAAAAAPAAHAQPTAADYTSPIAANAENIRSLNIMLMVTSLRCRTGVHDFQSEYDLFTAAHQDNLEEAHNHLTNNLVATHGEDGSHRALDRIGVSIANSYGDGHPTLGCSDLKAATLELAMSQDKARLAHMADRLLGGPEAIVEPVIAAEAALVGDTHGVTATNQTIQRPEKSRVLSSPRAVETEEVEAPVIPVERIPNWMRG